MGTDLRADPARLEVFTTGQAARVLRIGTRTLVKLVATQTIPSWRVPGSTHRRITRAALLDFARANNMDHAVEALTAADPEPADDASDADPDPDRPA